MMDSEFGLVQIKPEGKVVNLETGEIRDPTPEDLKGDDSRWIEMRYDPSEIEVDVEFIASEILTDLEHKFNMYRLDKEEQYSVLTVIAHELTKEDSGL